MSVDGEVPKLTLNFSTLNLVCVCVLSVCLSTTIIAQQATKQFMSDINIFSARSGKRMKGTKVLTPALSLGSHRTQASYIKWEYAW